MITPRKIRSTIFRVTRGGVPVAKFEPAFDRKAMEEAFADMDRIRKRYRGKGITTEEIVGWMREGREP
jgi:hypothetical protein